MVTPDATVACGGDARPLADRDRPVHARRADLPDPREAPIAQSAPSVSRRARPRTRAGRPAPAARAAAGRRPPRRAALAEVAAVAELDPRPARDPRLRVAARAARPRPRAGASGCEPQPHQLRRGRAARRGSTTSTRGVSSSRRPTRPKGTAWTSRPPPSAARAKKKKPRCTPAKRKHHKKAKVLPRWTPRRRARSTAEEAAGLQEEEAAAEAAERRASQGHQARDAARARSRSACPPAAPAAEALGITSPIAVYTGPFGFAQAERLCGARLRPAPRPGRRRWPLGSRRPCSRSPARAAPRRWTARRRPTTATRSRPTTTTATTSCTGSTAWSARATSSSSGSRSCSTTGSRPPTTRSARRG